MFCMIFQRTFRLVNIAIDNLKANNHIVIKKIISLLTDAFYVLLISQQQTAFLNTCLSNKRPSITIFVRFKSSAYKKQSIGAEYIYINYNTRTEDVLSVYLWSAHGGMTKKPLLVEAFRPCYLHLVGRQIVEEQCF